MFGNTTIASHLKLGVVVLAGLVMASTTRANLVPNGDFQTGDLTGWGAPGAGTSLEADAGPIGSGDYALHVLSANFVLALESNYFAVDASTTYTVSFDVKKGSTSSGNARTDIGLIRSFGGVYAGGPIILQDDALLADGNWHQVSWQITTTDGSPIKFSIWAAGNGGQRDLVLDNFQVAVPEPVSLALLAVGGLLLASRRRRA
ncbi:MAG: carbohydrate binding domain-containing protein [Phycisphaeraceae bacterium]